MYNARRQRHSTVRSICAMMYRLQNITKACLYNFDPLKAHFYTVKLEFTGVYNIFSYFAKKTEIMGRGGSNEYQQSMF